MIKTIKQLINPFKNYWRNVESDYKIYLELLKSAEAEVESQYLNKQEKSLKQQKEF